MLFDSPTHALAWYFKAWICLTNATPHNVFYEKTFRYSHKKFSLSRIDTMVTIGYYLSKLSKTCVFIIKCYYLGNISSVDVSRLLNEIQNTRRYRPKVVDEIYHKNLYRLGRYLNNAGLLRSE